MQTSGKLEQPMTCFHPARLHRDAACSELSHPFACMLRGSCWCPVCATLERRVCLRGTSVARRKLPLDIHKHHPPSSPVQVPAHVQPLRALGTCVRTQKSVAIPALCQSHNKQPEGCLPCKARSLAGASSCLCIREREQLLCRVFAIYSC